MLWTVPREWEDETAYILGGGPSLKLINVDDLKGRNVIAVNRAYEIASWAPVKYAGDWNFMEWYGVRFAKQKGYRVTLQRRYRDHERIRWLECTGSNGLETRPNRLRSCCSGYAAINLAFHFGVKRIVLFGFDMKTVSGTHNWHDGYPKKIRDDIYNLWIKDRKDQRRRPIRAPFDTLADALKEHGVECLNATPDSAMKSFPIVNPKKVL